MGSAASAGVGAALEAANEADLKEVIAGLSSEQRKRLKESIDKAAAPSQKGMSNMVMGKWSDKESSDMIQAILDQTTKGPPPDLFRKVRPFHLPEYKTKVTIGQDAPDGKVFELDNTETTLLAKISSMGHGPGKLIVVNFGSYT